MNIKIEIYKDHMALTESTNIVTVRPGKAYTSRRLLVGSFQPAVDCVRDGLSRLSAIGLFKGKPELEIHPREMVEGGLSEVEERCLTELGYAAGARKVKVVL